MLGSELAGQLCGGWVGVRMGEEDPRGFYCLYAERTVVLCTIFPWRGGGEAAWGQVLALPLAWVLLP